MKKMRPYFQQKKMLEKLSLLISLVLVIPFLAYSGTNDDSMVRPFTAEERLFLMSLFDTETYNEVDLERIFKDYRLKKHPVVVSRNVRNVENKDRYDDFLNAYSIFMAKKFTKKWKTTLKNASEQFDVDQEVLVALLLVETGLGNVLGKYNVLTVFASIIVEKEFRNRACKIELTDACQDDYVTSRLAMKADWATVELKSLLTIARDSEIDLFSLKGSFAGAFGIPQFLPSSYLKWGYDADQNGSVNLYLVPDAIYSAANYLKAHGWVRGIEKKDNMEVLFTYNNSQIYVDTVLEVAREVRRQTKKINQAVN